MVEGSRRQPVDLKNTPTPATPSCTSGSAYDTINLRKTTFPLVSAGGKRRALSVELGTTKTLTPIHDPGRVCAIAD